MNMEKDLEDVASAPDWFRYLVVGALLSGAGSGIIGITAPKDMDDRYRGRDAERDFSLRDARHQELQRAIDAHVQRAREAKADFEARIRSLEGRMYRMERENHEGHE